MILKDISFPTPEENILFDDVLFSLAEKGEGSDVLRFWESQQVFIVLGRICKLEEDVWQERTAADKIPILRRSSGGGTVVQGPGCLNYTLILSKELHPEIYDLRRSYQYISSKVIAALENLGIKAVYKPISDMAFEETEKKFSGNAQHRGRSFILHHGTLLYDFDLTLIEKYLKIPQSVPDYRRGRSHGEFIANLSIPAQEIKQALCRAFAVKETEGFLSSAELNGLQELLVKKDPTPGFK